MQNSRVQAKLDRNRFGVKGHKEVRWFSFLAISKNRSVFIASTFSIVISIQEMRSEQVLFIPLIYCTGVISPTKGHIFMAKYSFEYIYSLFWIFFGINISICFNLRANSTQYIYISLHYITLEVSPIYKTHARAHTQNTTIVHTYMQLHIHGKDIVQRPRDIW